MQGKFIRSSARAVVVGMVASAMVLACGDDDSTPVMSSSGSTSGSMSSSSGSSSTSSSGGATTLSLYDRLGGKAGLETFVADVVNNKILVDADLKTFFFNQVAMPIPAGHPSAKQITVCFARFVGSALKADTYPGDPVSDPANTNNPNHTCRDMVATHKGADTKLNIGDGNFDKFVGLIADALKPLVKPSPSKAGEISQAELEALGAALTSTKASVTTPGAPSTGPFVKP